MYRQIVVNALKISKVNLKLSNIGKCYQCCNNFSIVSSNIVSVRQFASVTYNYKHGNEKQYLASINDNPNVFGKPEQETEEDEGDIEETRRLENQPLQIQKLTIKQYADQIKLLISKRKIKEAIDILEIKMLKLDKVKPENYTYNLIIGACGQVGYTKKAFSLYNAMKKRGLQPTGGTYTALFNACANSPWPTTDGLSRAKHLYQSLIEKQYEHNVTNYNVMIKAFGRCGDLEMAFALVDEMATKKMAIKSETLNFLLQSCISDRNAGFRHALLVWRKFIQKHIKPNVFSYNLMLRCIRDCGMGDLKTAIDVINVITSSQANPKLLGKMENNEIKTNNADKDSYKIYTLTDGAIKENKELVDYCKNDYELIPRDRDVLDCNKPNLMSVIPTMGNILSVSEVIKAEDRLLLVGGWTGFLQNMKENNCMPNVKTFTQLLDSLPGSNSAEDNLIHIMKKLNIKPDIDFFNMLMRKRSWRFDYNGGKEVLEMIEQVKLQPNIITYGVLAIGCKTAKEAQNLIQEMQDAKYIINMEILGGMLTQAIYHNNFSYVMYLMQLCNSEGLKVSKKFLENLEIFKNRAKDISNDKKNPLFHSTAFQKGHKLFRNTYKDWLKEVTIDDSEEIHPWQQFRQTTETNTKHYKNKASRFKPVHLSKFKQKTSIRDVKRK